jgi:O-antigen/teichoic acid export membrane protein
MTVLDRGTEELSPSKPPELTSRVAVGVRWGLFNQIVQQVTRLLVTIALTRLLDPATFGIMAICTLTISLGDLFTGVGFGPALVHRQVVTRRMVASALSASAIMGVLLTIIVALLSGPVSSFFNTPDAQAPLMVLSLLFLLRGVEGVPNDMLRRDLHFRDFVLSSTAGGVISGIVGVSLAFAGAGIWALVAYALTDAFVSTSLAWVLAIRAKVWRPRFSLHWQSIRELASFSGYLVGARSLAYVQLNGDNFAIGRALGAQQLAYYGLAFRVMVLPVQKMSEVLGNVAFPAFAKVQHDIRRLRAGFLRGVRTIAVVCFPVTIGIVVTAPVMVPVVFGPKWVPSVVTLQILALNGPRTAMISLNSNLWQAIGKPKWSLWTSVFGLPLYLIAFAVGAWGFGTIEAVAVGLTIAGTISMIPTMHLAGKAIKRSPIVIFEEVGRIALATALMAATCILVGLALPNTVADVVELVAMVAAGALTYLIFIRLLAPDILPELIGSLTGKDKK